MQQQTSGVDFSRLKKNENRYASINYEYFKSYRGYLGNFKLLFFTFFK